MRPPYVRWLVFGLALVPLAGSFGCQSAYYRAMETFGYEKRDLLVERVEEGREAQVAAKAQFESALEAFRGVQSFDGGALEELHSRLEEQYDEATERVEAVRSRIEAIERVAEDLFEEWRDEIEAMQSPDLRAKSETLLRDTRYRYEDLLAAMQRAEARMQPVLDGMRDHVLFLKHNLNAQAIASLQGALGQIEGDVTRLIAEMEASIREADEFLGGL